MMTITKPNVQRTCAAKYPAACSRPVDEVVSSRKPVARQPVESIKRQLYAMLAEAVRNTSG